MIELKSELKNEELLHVLRFCQENNVEMRFNCNGCKSSEDAVNMKMYDGYARYNQMFSENDIKTFNGNVAEMFLKKANDELHPELDPDIYNYSGENHIVCFGTHLKDEHYRYVVMSIGGRHPTVYIQFPGIKEIDSYDNVMSPPVHGGFTFLGELKLLPNDGIWLGWDYAHCGDYIFTNWTPDSCDHIWTKRELEAEAMSTLTRIRDKGLVINKVIGRAE